MTTTYPSVSTNSGPGDPFSLATVNGFYGPGSWAAWYLSGLTSRVVINRNDYTRDFHIIANLLYTSWATIDFFRLLCKPVPALADDHDQLHGSLAAALLATS